MTKILSEFDEMRYEAKYGKRPTGLRKVGLGVSVLYKRTLTKLKETATVISGKRLAMNSEFVGAPRVSQEEVESNPRKWIIEECIPACQILWDKNIYTFMCSDALDPNAWIELELDCLSHENLQILEEIKKEYPCYQYHHGCVNIPVKGMGKKAQEELINIANRFVMQDVPVKHATITPGQVYIKCGCYEIVKNPDYVPFEEIVKSGDFVWGQPIQDEYIYAVDITKIKKSLDEYVIEAGAVLDSETGTIYESRFHYDKHLSYKESLGKIKGLK